MATRELGTTRHDDGSVTYVHANGTVAYGPPVNGTYYQERTPRAVIDVLERVRQAGTRVRLHYGDTETGRDWLSEWDVAGRVSRSMGPIKIPILVPRQDSDGGPGILDASIVRIRTTVKPYRDLYRHPLYHAPEMDIEPCDPPEEAPWLKWAVWIGDTVQARFPTEKGARYYVSQFA